MVFLDFTWDRGLFRGWSFKKVADMGWFLSRLHISLQSFEVLCPADVRDLSLFKWVKENDVEFNGRFRSHFQTWKKMAFQKLVQHSSTATLLTSKKTSPAKFQGDRYEDFSNQTCSGGRRYPWPRVKKIMRSLGARRAWGQGGYRMLFYVKRLHGAWKSCFVDGIPLGAHCSRRGVGTV